VQRSRRIGYAQWLACGSNRTLWAFFNDYSRLAPVFQGIYPQASARKLI
jgi:hypothetical protein